MDLPGLPGGAVAVSSIHDASMGAPRLDGNTHGEDGALTQITRTLSAVLDDLPVAILMADGHGKIVYLNTMARSVLGRAAELAIEEWPSANGLFSEDGITSLSPADLPIARALRGETVEGFIVCARPRASSEASWTERSARPLREPGGRIVGALAVIRDVTENVKLRRLLEQQLLEERAKNDALARLRSAVGALSTPILEVWDDILVVPIIGSVDSHRARLMTQKLLDAVIMKHSRIVILDVTGAEEVDHAFVQECERLVNAIKLLGAKCIVTGLQSSAARTFVIAGGGLESRLTTLRSVKCALRTHITAKRPGMSP